MMPEAPKLTVSWVCLFCGATTTTTGGTPDRGVCDGKNSPDKKHGWQRQWGDTEH